MLSYKDVLVSHRWITDEERMFWAAMYLQYKYLLMQNVVYELIHETGTLKDTGLTAKDIS